MQSLPPGGLPADRRGRGGRDDDGHRTEPAEGTVGSAHFWNKPRPLLIKSRPLLTKSRSFSALGTVGSAHFRLRPAPYSFLVNPEPDQFRPFTIAPDPNNTLLL